MTPDTRQVLQATPGSRSTAKTLGQISEGIDMQPMLIRARLVTLQAMGLVECLGDGWSRTVLGDEIAKGRGR